MGFAGRRIFLFDLGEAILPSRPQANYCCGVERRSRMAANLRPPKGLVLDQPAVELRCATQAPLGRLAHLERLARRDLRRAGVFVTLWSLAGCAGDGLLWCRHLHDDRAGADPRARCRLALSEPGAPNVGRGGLIADPCAWSGRLRS